MPSNKQDTGQNADFVAATKQRSDVLENVGSIPFSTDGITVVELHMMDKRMYYPLTALSGFTIRAVLYPFGLVKTRLQLQRQRTVYSSLFDAFGKIVANEGTRGLYRGFWISNLMIFSQVSYVATYETVRTNLVDKTSVTDNRARSFIAGACASVVGQTMVVPIDIVAQHLQLLGLGWQGSKKGKVKQHLNLPDTALSSRFGAARTIVSAIYERDGVRGFYRGYGASLLTYAPSSALWWFFYDIYCGFLSDCAPVWIPRLALQCLAAPLGGASTTFITTPLDAIRARIQVENTRFVDTARTLWHEEHMGIFVKGLSARLVQSLTFSFFIMLGYETVKRWSLLDEYKSHVRW